MIEFSYKTMKGSDGNLWLSVQPLMKDIIKSIQFMEKIDDTDFTDEDKEILNLKVVALTTVYEFLGAFIQEQLLKDEQAKHEGIIPLNTGATIH